MINVLHIIIKYFYIRICVAIEYLLSKSLKNKEILTRKINENTFQ